MNQIKLNYEELTLIKHASNLQAYDAFLKHAKEIGILESAPFEAVLKAFLEYKYTIERTASPERQSKYMTSINMLMQEELAKKN
jgi:hypothetical protein